MFLMWALIQRLSEGRLTLTELRQSWCKECHACAKSQENLTILGDGLRFHAFLISHAICTMLMPSCTMCSELHNNCLNWLNASI